MAEYLELLKDDVFKHFPVDIQESDDPQFRELADAINELRDELVFLGNVDGSLAIENLDDIFKCETIPVKLLSYLGEMFDAGLESQDSERTQKQKICRAVSYHRRHGTIWLIRTLIEEITTITPEILAFSSFERGWDVDESVDATGPYTLNYNGGLAWDVNEDYSALYLEGAFIWSILPTGILVDVKNDGAYTTEQWNKILAVVADQKKAELAAEVGYFDSGTGEKVVYQVVYSKNLSQTDWEDLVDPGIYP